MAGDSQALELLIQRYLPAIFNFVFGYLKNRDEAEEVTQEVFVKVWKNLSAFRPGLKFKPWLYAIAKNGALDRLKKKRPLTFSELERLENYSVAETLADTAPSALATLGQAENFEMLQLALEGLPQNYRATLDLRYNQDLKFREIAELLKQPLDTVKTWHRRGLRQLKKLLS